MNIVNTVKKRQLILTSEIKKYIHFTLERQKRDIHDDIFNIYHLQEFYRFLEEIILALYEISCDDTFMDITLHFAITTILDDLSILITGNEFCKLHSFWEIILQSLEYSFPINSLHFLQMKMDISIYGKHLHKLIQQYFT